MKQYIADAFTDRPFSGNPAAVCVMESWPSDEKMMHIARENNLSETAFAVKENDCYRLRWFTPGTEVELCGHATLAAAFVILSFYEKERNDISFTTLSGELTVRREGERFVMNFPMYELEEIPVTDDMKRAFGAEPVKALLGLDLICVFDSEDEVRRMSPDMDILKTLPGRIQNATSRGRKSDCVSRSFCPKIMIKEDPVCGSAHCQIAGYWADVLDKDEIVAFQASERGGFLYLRPDGDGRIDISGDVVLVSTAEFADGVI